MPVELMKEADAMICVLYKTYLKARKTGKPISESKYLGGDVNIKNSITPKLALDDVTELCWALKRKGLLAADPGDNRANDVRFTDEGLIYMENRFKGKIESVVKWLAKLEAFVPFI